ncbi:MULTISPECIES: DinB family protein [Persicobacter]|uniref:DUF1569 domain-containing protein n=1 Tax=Persicobacter diffluens TaxID=981 RepID=A0AAN4VXQ6_9BACT|nr:DinB family protein [Persicobacter sp. CCB-QB2]GJM60275.1 hypothetical protein PEDI_08270 [Persicobacter diffluens]
MEHKNLYEAVVFEEIRERIHQVKADTIPLWGKMNAAQMLAHTAEVQEVTNGKPLNNTPFLVKLFSGFIKKMVINDTPYPHNTKTHPQYVQKGEKNFEKEKERLLMAISEFYNTPEQIAKEKKHPIFGAMSLEEKGWGMYKHLDHHLRQFGV